MAKSVDPDQTASSAGFVVVLEFNDPVNTIKVILSQSAFLTMQFTITYAYSFVGN